MTIMVSQSKGRSASKPRQSLLGRISEMMAVRRQRRALLSLDAHMLKDIGVTRRDAAVEAQKPIWDAPTHWLK